MKKNIALKNIALKLSLPKSQMEELIRSYNAIGDWLSKSEEISFYGPIEIRPQGSIAIGTAIKPISEEDEYDVDLICNIKNSVLKTVPKILKTVVGNRIKENGLYEHIEEGKRCWKLKYANYHLDVLPCCPDTSTSRVLIATQKIEQNRYITHSTNPIEYRHWFLAKCRNLTIKESRDIEQIAIYENISDLQVIIRLLKRHRDIWIDKNNIPIEDKPVSIIITTLAANSYLYTGHLFEDFTKVCFDMPSKIENKNGKYIITNPVDDLENFADKWTTHPNREKIFFKWIKQLQTDVQRLVERSSDLEVSSLLKEMFGISIVDKVYNEYANSIKNLRETGNLFSDKKACLSEEGDYQVKNHVFYGKEIL